MISAAVLAVTAAIPPIGVVTIPVTLAAQVVAGVIQLFRSKLSNPDDDLGGVTFHLQGDGQTVQLTQVGVGSGQLVQMSADGAPGKAVVHCKGDGSGEYTYFLGIRGAVTKKAAQGLTVEAPLTSALPARTFVSWSSADSHGAKGNWLGREVVLIGPMGTAFYLHDDYPNFNQAPFTPRLPATAMVELQSQPGHRFIVLFSSPIHYPVLLIGSLGSTITFPDGVNATFISGDTGFTVNGNVVTGGQAGHADSNGTIRLSGTFSGFSFTLEPEADIPPVPGDGGLSPDRRNAPVLTTAERAQPRPGLVPDRGPRRAPAATVAPCPRRRTSMPPQHS